MVQKVPLSAKRVLASHPSLQHSCSPTDDHNGHVTASPHTTKADMVDANEVMHKKTLINVNKLPFTTVRPPALHCGGCERCVNPHQLQPNRFNTLALIFTACKALTVPPIANAPKRRSSQQLHRCHLLQRAEITALGELRTAGERASTSAIIPVYCHISSEPSKAHFLQNILKPNKYT